MKVQTLKSVDDYTAHLLKLDLESRYLRFGIAANDDIIRNFTSKIKTQPDQHQIFAVYHGDDVIGIGHVSRVGPELAFSVLPDYRKQGLGGLLMRTCLDWCREQGYQQGIMVCLQSNASIRRLAARHGMMLESQGGETLATFRLDGLPSV